MGAEKTVLEQSVERFIDHAVLRHVDGSANGYNEFAALGISDTDPLKGEKLQALALDILDDPATQGVVFNERGSHLYFYNPEKDIFISIEPKSGGSMYRPSGNEHFQDKIDKATQNFGDEAIHVERGGFKALNDAFVERYGHLARIGPLNALGQTFDEMLGKTPRILRIGASWAPAIGTAVAFYTSRAEAADMRENIQEAIIEGRLPPEALNDYAAVILEHQIQMNIDPSIAFGEMRIQSEYELFKLKYAEFFEADPDLTEELEPPSSLENISGLELEIDEHIVKGPYNPLLDLPVNP